MNSNGGFLHPEEIIKQFNINKNAQIADFGCGSGYFSIPLAKVAEEGKVYALDVLKEVLESVSSRMKFEGIFNIETRRCNLEIPNDSKLEDNSIDFVFLINILFQINNMDGIIKEAKRVLKMNGKIIIIDWKKDQPVGPPSHMTILLESVKKSVLEHNLKFEKEFLVDKYHWGIMFVKQ